ncbi:hypothetical protein [Myxococcus phage Mx4 ts27htf-1hrm-1]|nr:hypothetical protein Mx4_p33 [Myxococcus phage Mx4]WNM70373.1 hypothetical protein [Myxococcus phage Mx4 ts27htf-1hrm-1]
MACRGPTQLELCFAPPARRRRRSEDGVRLRGPGGVDYREAHRLAEYARGLLRRGAEPVQVAQETGIRLNTLHQMLTRLRRCGTPGLLGEDDLP